MGSISGRGKVIFEKTYEKNKENYEFRKFKAPDGNSFGVGCCCRWTCCSVCKYFLHET